MWNSLDEGIRSRIKKNSFNSSRTKLITFVLLLVFVLLVIWLFVNIDELETTLPPDVILPMAAIIVLGFIAIFYVYFINIARDSKRFDDAVYMTVGKVVSVDSHQNSKKKYISVRVPGDSTVYQIECDPDFYEKANADSPVLIVSSSRKNEDNMLAIDPEEYDVDGIL